MFQAVFIFTVASEVVCSTLPRWLRGKVSALAKVLTIRQRLVVIQEPRLDEILVASNTSPGGLRSS